MQRAVALDPDVAVGVDEDLVDLVVGEQCVERAEAVEAGDGGADQPLTGVCARQWSDATQVGAHHVGGVAVLTFGRLAQLGDQTLVERGAGAHWCTIASCAASDVAEVHQ